MTEVRTRVSQSRVRLPDIAVVSRSRPRDYPAQVVPPLIAIELLSPDDRLHRVLVRLQDFLNMGVKSIWLIDPEERSAYAYTANGLKLVADLRLTLPGSSIYVDLTEIFAELD